MPTENVAYGFESDPNIPKPSDPLMGTIEMGGFVSETPPDIEDFLTEAGFKDKAYVCTIKKAPVNGSGIKEFLPITEKGTYPAIEDIGRRFGPGQYFYCFAWSQKDPATGKHNKLFKDYKVYLGSAWDDVHDEYMAELYFKKEREVSSMAQRKKLQDASRGIVTGEKNGGDAIENLKRTTEVLRDIGVPIGKQIATNDNNGNGNNMFLAMMQMQAENSKNTMAMFMQMMGLMMKTNQPQNSNNMFREIMDMVKNTLDLKSALNPEKQSTVDKFFALGEAVLPAILELATKPREQRVSSPLVNVVRQSASFNEIKNDPAMLEEAIKKWDTAHGIKQTDIILDTVGLKRPYAQENNVQENSGQATEVPQYNEYEEENEN